MSALRKQKVVVLGSTGSIGVNTLDVIARHPDRFEVIALTAYRNMDLLADQVAACVPQRVVVADGEERDRLISSLKGSAPEIALGVEGLIQAATLPEADIVVSAIVGAAGLVPTLAAVRVGKRVALANKETLVMAGRLVMEEAKKSGARILPVDSEHSAIYQCLSGEETAKVRRLILTASGGPFRRMTRGEMERVRAKDALRHPRWEMGRKISIDSATLMNKGLEVIEARWLFDMPVERIDIVVHPESIVHSMVEFHDGSVLAQMGLPDMRVPIAYALGYPERLESGVEFLNVIEQGPLTFEPPDRERFPALSLAEDALRQGGVMPAVLNAANEVAVNAFLQGRIDFLRIPRLIRSVMEKSEHRDYETAEEILRTDLATRKKTREEISRL
ncbi:MAG: 1-deoxy-D-xylulose-5-phosphate reductoisomerase [Deltaproteobacteria bacterium]|nr:1-deoxy-D-xylulose-5-phosphate reductoisomerase [Deltaproteobacteria bacterium]